MILMLVLTVYVFASLFSWLQARLLNGIVQRAMDRLRKQVEDKIHRLPLSLLRQGAARRAAQPRDERRRQHRPVDAADAVAGRDLAADGGRRAGDDVPHLAAARGDRARDDSADDRHHGARRAAFAEAVRRAVEGHRHPERTRRGDLLGALDREGVRSPERGRGGLPRRERRGVPGELRRAVPVGHDHARHDVHREPRLRRDRRGRRSAGRGRTALDRRRAGLHPVLAAVHPAAEPARLDGEPAAVGRRERRARVRAARRDRGGARRRRCRVGARVGGPPRVRGCRVQLQPRQAADRRAQPDREAGQHRRDRRTDRRGQDDAGEPHHAVLRRRRAGGSRSTASTRCA